MSDSRALPLPDSAAGPADNWRSCPRC